MRPKIHAVALAGAYLFGFSELFTTNAPPHFLAAGWFLSMVCSSRASSSIVIPPRSAQHVLFVRCVLLLVAIKGTALFGETHAAVRDERARGWIAVYEEFPVLALSLYSARNFVVEKHAVQKRRSRIRRREDEKGEIFLAPYPHTGTDKKATPTNIILPYLVATAPSCSQIQRDADPPSPLCILLIQRNFYNFLFVLLPPPAIHIQPMLPRAVLCRLQLC